MSKRCIVVYGNVASGKTTLCQYLLQNPLLAEFKHLCLDDIKIEQFKQNQSFNLLAFNELCKNMFFEKLKTMPLVIYESLGIGTHYEHTIKYLKANGYELFFMHKTCAPEQCLQYYQQRHSLQDFLKKLLLVKSKEYAVNYSYLIQLHAKLTAQSAAQKHLVIEQVEMPESLIYFLEHNFREWFICPVFCPLHLLFF